MIMNDRSHHQKITRPGVFTPFLQTTSFMGEKCAGAEIRTQVPVTSKAPRSVFSPAVYSPYTEHRCLPSCILLDMPALRLPHVPTSPGISPRFLYFVPASLVRCQVWFLVFGCILTLMEQCCQKKRPTLSQTVLEKKKKARKQPNADITKARKNSNKPTKFPDANGNGRGKKANFSNLLILSQYGNPVMEWRCWIFTFISFVIFLQIWILR